MIGGRFAKVNLFLLGVLGLDWNLMCIRQRDWEPLTGFDEERTVILTGMAFSQFDGLTILPSCTLRLILNQKRRLFKVREIYWQHAFVFRIFRRSEEE